MKLGNDDSELSDEMELTRKYTLITGISLIEAASSRLLTVLVLERGLMVPGETLHMTGGVIHITRVAESMSPLGSKLSSLFEEGCRDDTGWIT